MHRRLFGAFGIVAVLTLTVGSCKDDPFSDLDGGAASVVTDFSYLQLAIGGQATVVASVLDGRATPLAVPIAFTPCTADVTAAIDTSYHPVPATSARAIVTAVTANPSCVVVSGGGVSDTITVAVLPQGIASAISNTTPEAGDTITIGATAVLKFETSTVAVTFGGGSPGLIVAKTPDLLTVLVPFSDPGPLTIDGVVVTYVAGLVVSLPTTISVTQTGDSDPVEGDDAAFATAPVITIPAAGASASFITNFNAVNNATECAETATNFDFGSTGPCVIYRFTVAAPTEIEFTVDWDSDADLDTYACGSPDPSDTGDCFEDGGAGATGAQPQAFTFTFPAGTHYLVVENYDGVATRNIYVTARRP